MYYFDPQIKSYGTWLIIKVRERVRDMSQLTLKYIQIKKTIPVETPMMSRLSFDYSLPKGHKILSIVFIGSAWPLSPTSCRVLQPIINPEIKSFTFFLTTIYDPNDEWSVEVTSTYVDNQKRCEAQLPSGFILTGGAYSFEPSITHTFHSCSTNGCKQFYPKDATSFFVEMNNRCDTDMLNFKLGVHAIGLKSNTGIQLLQNCTTGQHDNGLNGKVTLTEPGFTLSGGYGYQILTQNEENQNAQLVNVGISPVEKSIYLYTGMQSTISHIIGIKHPELEISILPPIIETH